MMLHCSYIITSRSAYHIPFYYQNLSHNLRTPLHAKRASFTSPHLLPTLINLAVFGTKFNTFKQSIHVVVVEPTKCTFNSLNGGNLSEMDTSQERKHTLYVKVEPLIPLLLPLCSQASSGIKLSCSTTSAACETA